ncbi:MAG: hypothetical protein GC162_12570 [Planctomycetes bacterium]|nr:hypothetical protein [Planctomycetota bacterium]
MARMRKHQKSLARKAVWAVMGLQTALLACLVLDPTDPPRTGTLWQALWALAHRPAFYPLVGLLIVGPPATFLAYSVGGRHRKILVFSWIFFGALAVYFFGMRLWIMLLVLYVHTPR